MKLIYFFAILPLFLFLSWPVFAQKDDNDYSGPSWQIDQAEQIPPIRQTRKPLEKDNPTGISLQTEQNDISTVPQVDIKRPGYLEAGPSLKGMDQENLTDYSPLVEVRTLRKKVVREVRRNEKLEEDNAFLQRQLKEIQDRLYQQTNQIETLKKEVVEKEFKRVAIEQQITRIKLAILRKKMVRESKFPRFYTVVKNDSLWRIASKSKIYDDPYKWIEIFYANKDKIADPDYIYPGMVLNISRPELADEDWTIKGLDLDSLKDTLKTPESCSMDSSEEKDKTKTSNPTE